MEVKSDYSSATSQGFRVLFNFIVGDNAMRSKISMTVPDNKNIKLKEVKPHRAVALRFSGYMGGKKAMRRIAELKEWMAKNGLKPKPHFTVARYDPLWIHGFLRKNEVIVEIT